MKSKNISNYEQAMKRLQEIVDKLEQEKVSLEDSVKLYEEGTQLASFCNTCLNTAEQKILSASEIDTVEALDDQ